LELSRLESTDGEAPRDPIDVPRMLERLHRDALAGGDRPRQVSLDLESDDGLYGSTQEIESAFTNLLVNGIKYTLSEGTVRMRWWTDDDGAYFSVIDNGIGIPAEHIPRLTERFYRVDAGRSRDRGGSGLGLAIVKHALQRHGGWLDVQSTEGKGSTFTCHFPPQRIWHTTLHAAASA
jgi:two-component system phosphate regulon sensor histidine kinase PhoR